VSVTATEALRREVEAQDGLGLTPAVREVVRPVVAALSPDLLRPEWRGRSSPLAGQCYVCSEAIYHLLGGKAHGWTPVFVRHEGAPHWFLRRSLGPSGFEVVDATAGQFKAPVPHERGVPKGFLTREPSKRARTLMGRIK
jgi:hypothetical protein